MSLEIQKPWARASDTKPWRYGGFLTLANRSPTPDRLVSATSPLACSTLIYGIKVVGPNMTMRRLEDGLRIPGDTTITLRPRGYHLFFLGTKPRPKVGDKVPVTLVFEKAGEREIVLDVQGPGPVGRQILLENP